MKNILYLLGFSLLLCACKDEIVPKPAKLISEDEMVSIIYELSILEAARSQYPQSNVVNGMSPRQYVYKKYNIDSLQFALSNHYYAADVANYRKMYGKVSFRIEAEQKKADSLLKLHPQPSATPTPAPLDDTPQIK